MGKVKRGRKINLGHWDSYSWICAECGREWSSRTIAYDCKHTNQVLFYSHDGTEVPMNIEDYVGEAID